ncbi:MAG: cobalamin biosynthesis protein CbiA, partial [Candidatus Zixiibacteriota bacterium]
LARHCVSRQSMSENPVSIVDLDIINPYFRSREASAELEKLGIKVLNPQGGQFYADLPIILPEIKGAIKDRDGTIILDVGGDDSGARVLSTLAEAFTPDNYELMLVLNANRPFTSNVEGCIKMINEIETASRLSFTGLIANTHLMDETTPDDIITGLNLAHKVSDKTKLPIRFLSITNEVLAKVSPDLFDVPVLPLNRSLLKPWEKQ